MLTMRSILLLTCGSLLGPISTPAPNHPRFDSRTALNGLLSPLSVSDAIYSDAHGSTHPTTVGTGLRPRHQCALRCLVGRTHALWNHATALNRLTPAPLLPLSPKQWPIRNPSNRPPPGFRAGSRRLVDDQATDLTD